MTPDDEELVAGWIAEALQRLEAGEPVDVDELCRERPEFRDDVAAAVGMRERLPALHQREREFGPTAGILLAERYLLQQVVGAGAAGTVWRARDERLQRDVAVKLLHPGLFAGLATEQRFHREAVVLAGYEHAHVVRIYDQGTSDDGTNYLVTELLDGRSLADLLAAALQAMPDGPSLPRFGDLDWLRRELPDAEIESTWLRQAVRWVAQLGEGLALAHRDDVCHRDVKPGNAFVRDDGEAVLLDFGIAARVGDASITRTHTVLGTPCYMAPEQAAGDSDPSPALDVYGLTATLYHLLTLRPPHAGDLQQVMVSLRHEDPIPAARLCSGLPRDLQAILDRGLERRPDHRYPSMAALVQDLRAFLDHAPVVARPLGRLTRGWRRLARRPTRAVAVLATALAVVFGAFGVYSLSGMQARAAEREWHERHRRLPADICIEGWPDERALVPLPERTRLLDELDRLVALDRGDVGMLLLRAASSLDYDDHEQARADMRRIASLADSDYVRELANRYADAQREDDGRWVPDLSDLPEPRLRDDYFLAGFHALRARDVDRAVELLDHVEDYLPARDLRLLAIVGQRKKNPERAIAEAAFLEGQRGFATARTQHALAVAHLHLQLFRKALPYCERCLELRPGRHGPWTNLGFANLRLGNLDEALRCYRRAVEIRPWMANSLSGLSQTWRALGDFDRAREVAMQIRDDGWRAYELGCNELARAAAALVHDEREPMKLAAQRAIEHFEAAGADRDSRNPKQRSVRAQIYLADAIANEHREKVLAPLLLGLRSDPRSPRQIANLSRWLGDSVLTADTLGRLRLWLLDLAIDLAPEDPHYRKMRTSLLQRMRSR